MKKLIKKLNIIKVTEEEMEEIEKDSTEKGYSIFTDVNLESHIETLLYNGIEEETIINIENMNYGDFIDFYYNGNMYYMIIGTR